MGKILKLAVREIRKKKFFALLMFVVCLIAMHTILSSITNATSAFHQQKIFEDCIGYDMKEVLHLDYQYTEEHQDFAGVLSEYRDYIGGLPGVEAVGRFDATGIYFSELKTSEAYREVNTEIVKDGKYADHADITQLLCVDESILSFVDVGISEYADTKNGFLPIYASEVFREIIPIGMILTDVRTGDKYEVCGYISKGSRWVEEDDLIRFPMVSIDGWFIAPFTNSSEKDIMTQLSCLHNTYVLTTTDGDIDFIKQAISEYPPTHGFEATAYTLAEEYEAYCMETEVFTTRQIALAVFISIMAVSSIIAVFTTNTLLKRKQYGVLIANGFTQNDIAVGIAAEIAVIVFPSAWIAWMIKWMEFRRSTDLFRDILLTAHIHYTLPICCLIAVLLVAVAALIPAIKVFRYQPCELLGGNTNGNY